MEKKIRQLSLICVNNVTSEEKENMKALITLKILSVFMLFFLKRNIIFQWCNNVLKLDGIGLKCVQKYDTGRKIKLMSTNCFP